MSRSWFVSPVLPRAVTLLGALLGLVASLAGPACADNPNTLSESEKAAGWRLLFDGRTLDGWRNFKQEQVSEGWQIKDGVLTRAANGAGDLITRDQFESFELSLDYRISVGGNSGLMFHVTEDAERPWHTGPEVQIQDNVAGHDPQKAGWLYQLYPAPTDATRPAGQWNELRLRIAPDNCEIQMNGIRYSQFKLGSPDWDRRVAESKFKSMAGFGKAGRGHICLQDHGNLVEFRNIKIRVLGEPEREQPRIAAKATPAFERLQWADWKPVDDEGRAEALRPIVLTHAGDGSNRVFVATQHGVIHVFPNRDDAERTKVFLNIRPRVVYNDRQNEEGFLGLAFHPKYKENGQFFAYYTSTAEPQLSVISRFRVSKDDPDRADPDSEEIVLKIKQPYWNHNGGTIAFGPDGMLYVGLGDGGAGNDPHGNGQNLSTLLGSVLRIDVDHKADGKGYAIPADNPFVGKEGAAGEIWAYGFRNIWRMSFDRETGELWAGDVGQNIWEEIDIVTKGGNYGWNHREGMHPFGPEGTDASSSLIDPIFEYSHDIGKSITGGHVYRGARVPALRGAYLYADYVSGKIWALKYDREARKVQGNYLVDTPNVLPVVSFGEDEQGEVYFMIVTANGKGLFRFAPE